MLARMLRPLASEWRCGVAAQPIIDMPLAMSEERPCQVQVSLAVNEGWNVTVTLDGRVVTVRHCHDWHNVERARECWESELHARAR